MEDQCNNSARLQSKQKKKRQGFFFDSAEFGKAYLETASGSFCVQVYRALNTQLSIKTNCKKRCVYFLQSFSFPNGKNQANTPAPAQAKRQELFQKHY